MSLTPSTGAAPYATPALMTTLYDARDVAQLCSDNGVAVAPTDLATNAILLFELQDASGEIELACTVGGRYTAADLAALVPGTNGYAKLAGLTVRLAFEALRRRRGQPESDRPEAVLARETLAALRMGEAALPFVEVAAAGLPATSDYTPADLFHLDRPSDQAHRFFGQRGRRRGAGQCF